MFLRKENFHLRSNRIWKGADLLMEIVSGRDKVSTFKRLGRDISRHTFANMV
jgi:hypothetical protein